MSQIPATITDVGTESADWHAMQPDLRLVGDIMGGARKIRAAGERYLPRYEGETRAEYDRRLKCAPWRPEFKDAVRSLASKPFEKPVTLRGTVPPPIAEIAEDVDLRGNDLTRFAAGVFEDAVANGLAAIMVDFPALPAGSTVADEKAAGARPYWVHVRGETIIAAYSEMQGGREVLTHVRLREFATIQDGYGEREVERIRVLETDHWELWEKIPNARQGEARYRIIEGGPMSIGGGPPLALFCTAPRSGTYRVRPPLADLADMQIELYRAMSRQDEVLTFSGSPMLAGIGFAPEKNDTAARTVEVGPKRVLFAPAAIDGGRTGWEFVQPDAANIKEIREQVGSIIEDMRRLGMQPLTPKSGNVTATATSVEAAKAHSTVESWALAFKDALEQAFVLTCAWLKLPPMIEVEVHTDFAVSATDQVPLDALDKARARKDISARTYWSELKRRNVLSADFDADAEEQAVAEEVAGLDPEEDIDPVRGVRLVSGG